MLGVALAAVLYGALRSVLLIATSLNENDFQVVSGGLLILSVLLANAPELRRRAEVLLRRLRPPRRGRRAEVAADAGVALDGERAVG
jgi:hypothetical protein